MDEAYILEYFRSSVACARYSPHILSLKINASTVRSHMKYWCSVNSLTIEGLTFEYPENLGSTVCR